MLVYAIVSITLALIFYTIGVWSEKIQGVLKKWHLAIFWLGLIFDTLGTTLMSKIAGEGFQLNFHGITGLLAIVLMLFHAIWATKVLLQNDERAKLSFHKFSVIVWLVWLIPYISGAIFGVSMN
ncbi:HsmA family protein [Fusibacter bizertensis]